MPNYGDPSRWTTMAETEAAAAGLVAAPRVCGGRMSRFEACCAELLDIEGSYSNRSPKAGPGGPTMNGVTWQTYNAYRDVKGLQRRDVREMEPHERREIYWGQYWRAAGCEHLPPGLDLTVFDFAVH